MKRHLFHAILIVAGLGAAYGYRAWQLDPFLVGTVETRLHRVGAREGGQIQQLLVAVGSPVTAGQVLARLDVSDLAIQREGLEKQLVAMQDALAADRQVHALEYGLLQLRVSQALAAVQADLAQLNALNREIQALEAAGAAGLGRDRDLSRLRVQRDAVRASVAQASALIQGRDWAAVEGTTPAARDRALTSLLGDRVESIHETLRRLARVDQRLEYRTVRAPCQGLVVAITARQGTTVDAYRPVVTVEDPRVAVVEVYLPEMHDQQVAVGQPVEVTSRRSSRYNTTGHIRFIHPGYTPMPERQWLRGQVMWARKLEVELAPDHALLPGESVGVRILQGQRSHAAPGT